MSVLSNACLEDIRQKCAQNNFTHVHILAHGGECEVAGETRFGLVLCAEGNPQEKDVVDGKRLAQALQAQSIDGVGRSSPLVVTLATCDSGNTGSVLVPGGSLAHDLHAAGIPWVFASQFPLTKDGSIRIIDSLYPGLLRGDDPRQLLHETRRRLYMANQRDHDWASLVVYASVSVDFEEEVATFFEDRSLSAIENALGRVDDLAATPGAANIPELEKRLDQVRKILAVWISRLPDKDSNQPGDAARRAHCYGMHGSVFKRIALLRIRQYRQQEDGPLKEKLKLEASETLKRSLDYYRKATNEQLSALDKFHWVATQVVSLSAALREPSDPVTFELARQVAKRNLQRASVEEQAWAHGTLAELEMIGASLKAESEKRDILPDEADIVLDHCKSIVALMGRQSFQVQSTRRQFHRYQEYWPERPWKAVADRAVTELRASS
jgi:hypothetical protein